MNMRNLYLQFIHFFTSKKSYKQTNQIDVLFIEKNYGIYKSATLEKDAIIGTTMIEHSVLGNINLIEKTERIKAEKGIEFGVEYILKSNDTATIKLQIEWKFPKEILDPAKNIKLKRINYAIALPTNFVNNSNYTLDNDFEVIKGSWQLIIRHKKKVVYTRKFILE